MFIESEDKLSQENIHETDPFQKSLKTRQDAAEEAETQKLTEPNSEVIQEEPVRRKVVEETKTEVPRNDNARWPEVYARLCQMRKDDKI